MLDRIRKKFGAQVCICILIFLTLVLSSCDPYRTLGSVENEKLINQATKEFNTLQEGENEFLPYSVYRMNKKESIEEYIFTNETDQTYFLFTKQYNVVVENGYVYKHTKKGDTKTKKEYDFKQLKLLNLISKEELIQYVDTVFSKNYILKVEGRQFVGSTYKRIIVTVDYEKAGNMSFSDQEISSVVINIYIDQYDKIDTIDTYFSFLNGDVITYSLFDEVKRYEANGLDGYVLDNNMTF